MSRLGLGLAVALVIFAALADLWVSLRPAPDPIDPDTMARARTVVEEKRRPGALVVHSPLFGVRELKALNGIAARPDLPDLAVRARRTVLVIDRQDAPMGGFGAASELEEIGPLVLKVFLPSGEVGGRLSVFDLRDALRPQTASIERPAGRVVARCTRPRREGGFGCPGQPSWLYVAVRRLHLDGQDRECIWAHPTAGGLVVFNLPAPAEPSPGHRLELELQAAMTDDAVRLTPDGAAVRTRVLQGGRSIGQVVRDNRIGWVRRNLQVGPNQPIRLEVSAVRDGRRHHCLNVALFEVPE